MQAAYQFPEGRGLLTSMFTLVGFCVVDIQKKIWPKYGYFKSSLTFSRFRRPTFKHFEIKYSWLLPSLAPRY